MDPRLSFLVPALVAAAAAGAQTVAPCGPGNPLDQCFDQETPGVETLAADGERFGAALAFGDFDGDGFADLAVGAPRDDGLGDDAGFVHVFYGSPDGLVFISGTDQFGRGELPGATAAAGDEFGAALAAGDFDGDGFDDLAFGVPLDDHPGCGLGGCDDGGSFHVVYGSAEGLDLSTAETFEDLGTSTFVPGDGFRLGAVLGAGRIDGDGIDDLLVCAPGYGAVGEVPERAGRCYRVFGAPGGLGDDRTAQVVATGTGAFQRAGEDLAVWDPDDDGLGRAAVGHPRFDFGAACPDCGAVLFSESLRLLQGDLDGGANAAGAELGAALAAGRFDGDNWQDLAIGVPGHDDPLNTGRLYVVYGAPGAFDPGGFDSQQLDALELGEAADGGDRLGAELAAADFDGDGVDDLAIGAPGENAFRGQVTVVFGSDLLGTLDLARKLHFPAAALGGVPFQGAALGSRLAAGDVDGDGRAELAIGAPSDRVDRPGSDDPEGGRVYVHSFPAGARLVATKSVAGSFAPGGAVTYTVTLVNTGVAPQLDVPGSDELVDVVPGQLTVTSVSASRGNAAASGNRVTWNGVVGVTGSVTVTIVATVNAGTAGETVSNQAVVHFDGDADGASDASVPTDDPGTPAALDATRFEVFCGAAEDDLVLVVNTVDGEAVHEACSSITAGLLFAVDAGDDVTFRAGDRVVLEDGFRVLAGGRFTAAIADP